MHNCQTTGQARQARKIYHNFEIILSCSVSDQGPYIYIYFFCTHFVNINWDYNFKKLDEEMCLHLGKL